MSKQCLETGTSRSGCIVSRRPKKNGPKVRKDQRSLRSLIHYAELDCHGDCFTSQPNASIAIWSEDRLIFAGYVPILVFDDRDSLCKSNKSMRSCFGCLSLSIRYLNTGPALCQFFYSNPSTTCIHLPQTSLVPKKTASCISV